MRRLITSVLAPLLFHDSIYSMESPGTDDFTREGLMRKAQASGETLTDMIHLEIAIRESQITGSAQDETLRHEIDKLKALLIPEHPSGLIMEGWNFIDEPPVSPHLVHRKSGDKWDSFTEPDSPPLTTRQRRNSFELTQGKSSAPKVLKEKRTPVNIDVLKGNLLSTLLLGGQMQLDSPDMTLVAMQIALKDTIRLNRDQYGITESHVDAYFSAINDDIPRLVNHDADLIDQVRQLLSRILSLTARLSQTNPVILEQFAKIVKAEDEGILEKIDSIRMLYESLLRSKME